MYPDNYSEKNNYTMQTGTTTTRDGQVQEELNELGFSIDGLEKAIESLAVRYAPVTHQAAPQTEAVGNEKKDSTAFGVGLRRSIPCLVNFGQMYLPLHSAAGSASRWKA